MSVIKMRVGLLLSTTLGCAAVAAPCMAQVTPVATVTGVENDEIVVTGSRVRSAGAPAVSPVVSVSSDEIRLTGSPRIEDVLNTLPAISPSQGSQVNGFGNGTATVDLRHLGPTRTLVLIDSKRLMPGDPTAPSPDINNVPVSLIDRVDVLTGGASTVYGSDAVAGVVNFVLKHDFSGVAIDGSLGFYQHDNDATMYRELNEARGFPVKKGSVADGLTKDINLIIGSNTADGKGNVTAYGGFRQVNAVLWSERDFSSCVVQSDDSGKYCGGSAGTAPALFVPSNGSFLTLDRTTGLLRNYTSNDSYNYAPVNLLQRGETRYTAGALAHYSVSPGLEVYGDFSYMRNEALRQLAPDGVYNTFSISCANPLLTANQVSAFCTSRGLTAAASTPITIYRRNVEGGARPYRITHQSFRAVAGARGLIDPAWNYDVYAQYGRTDYNLKLSNAFAQSRIANAMDARVSPTTQQVVCASVLSGTDTRCAVYNPFTLNGVTQAALDYMTIEAYQTGSTTEHIASAVFTGKLGEYGLTMPWAADGATIAIGAEYRREALVRQPDAAYASGEIDGTPVARASGSFEVKELFTELRLPIVEDQRFAQSLSFEGGLRYSDYSTAGGATTYKIAGEWTPVRGISLRGGYNRAIRAPNLVELFTPQARGTTATQDPCAGTTPTATLARCQASGVTAAQYGTIAANPNGQYTYLSGGNDALRPETSDTYTAGVSIAPSGALRGLVATIDYFDIKVRDYVTSFGGALSLSQCVATGNPAYCSLIHRDPTSGSLWIGNTGYIDGRNTNVGSLQTSGIDLNVSYQRAVGSGRIGVAFNGTWLDSLESEPLPGVTRYDCAGYYGLTCGQPAPTWRHKMRATWYTPADVDLSIAWRYVGAVQSDRLIPSIGGVIPAVDQRIRAFHYADLAASWRLSERYTLSASINNVLDKTPPIIGANYIGSYSNGGTYPGVYDLLGRYIVFGFKGRF